MSGHQKRGTDDRQPKPKPQQENKNATTDSTDDQSTPSLVDRIQASASGLARNALFSSTPSSDTAHLLSDGSKAAPSSASSALAAAERYRGTSSSSSLQNELGYLPAETFRSSSSTTTAEQRGGFELPALTEDEFQHSYGGDLSETIADTDKGKGKGKGVIPKNNSYPTTTSSQSPVFDTTTTLSNPSDGAAVIALLSDKTFDPEFPPSAHEPPDYLDTELHIPQLTPEELRMLESFRRQIPPPEFASQPPSQTNRLTSFSLVPDINSFLDTIPSSTSTEATALRDTVLTGLSGAEDWISVEEKYHDEVWGYLQPTLEAAARELESRKESSAPSEDGPAVRRLKMILKHMQE